MVVVVVVVVVVVITLLLLVIVVVLVVTAATTAAAAVEGLTLLHTHKCTAYEVWFIFVTSACTSLAHYQRTW